MTLFQTPGSLKRLRRTPWRFQKTFLTPLKNLKPFVATILSNDVKSATLTIEQYVFEPKNLIALLGEHSLPPECGCEWAVTATGDTEVVELLEAALGDWLDFWFIPTPKSFVIYADHEEYTTFFAKTKSNLNRAVQALSAANFSSVSNYERRF
jgi:hypothetical protein